MRKLELRRRGRAAPPVPDPPESRPRAVRLTPTGRFVLVLGTLLAAGAPSVGFLLTAQATQRHELVRLMAGQALSVRGEVLSLRKTGGKNPRYIAVYQYNAGGAVYQGRAGLRRSTWARLHKGAPLEVRYLASQPERSWVAGQEPGPIPFWLPALASAGLAFFSALCWREIRRQRWLLAEGRLTHGQVLKVSRTGKGSGPQSWSVSYEFRTLSGAAIRGKGTMSGNPPDPGSAIRVLYDPDNPSRNAPYPLSLVRPA